MRGPGGYVVSEGLWEKVRRKGGARWSAVRLGADGAGGCGCFREQSSGIASTRLGI